MSRIALDAMGGDRAPEETVAGAIAASAAGMDLVLVGDRDRLEPLLSDVEIPVVHASQVIEMAEDPARAIREKKDASVSVAARLVADGDADGFVSAGSTGAALAAAAFIIGRVEGVSRPAIASIFPFGPGIVVLDVGANLDVKPENLVQFGVMGTAVAEIYLERKDPRVGLLNIGEEPGKGRDLEKDAFDLMSAQENLHFIGNVEGRDLATGRADVFVTDGFTGNVLLKTSEGASTFLAEVLAETLLGAAPDESARTRLVERLAGLRARLDPESYGGAHLLGTKGVVVIAHGSSSRVAVFNALRMATEGAEYGLVQRVAAGVAG